MCCSFKANSIIIGIPIDSLTAVLLVDELLDEVVPVLVVVVAVDVAVSVLDSLSEDDEACTTPKGTKVAATKNVKNLFINERLLTGVLDDHDKSKLFYCKSLDSSVMVFEYDLARVAMGALMVLMHSAPCIM
mgnify:CR=1 FL=1